jgi:exosortase K
MTRSLSKTRAWLPAPLDAAAYTLAFVLAYAVKHHCSTAGADQLTFLLRPTAALVAYATGHEFIHERGAGFFCRELKLMIAPVCSGANFLIVAFTTLVLGFSARTERPSRKLAWFFVSAGLAYLTTLLINAGRITLSLGFSERLRDIALSPAALHRLLGIITYLVGLLALYAVAGRFFAKRTLSGVHLAVPLGVYAGVTLLVPWLRGAGSRPDYWAHAGVLVSVITVAAVLCFFGRAVLLGQSRPSLGRHGDRRRSLGRTSGGALGGSDQVVQ